MFGLENRPPTEEELGRMLALIEESMDAGCWGISTGIYFALGSYASLEALVTCCKVVARYGGIHSSHIRDESTYTVGLLASVKEVMDIGRLSGVRSEIAHIKCLGSRGLGQVRRGGGHA
ncbi:MAG: hypothetical protein Q8P31_06255 [Bacillota bacterium]|nr:hypothetical protein [Bacillota bacterium]